MALNENGLGSLLSSYAANYESYVAAGNQGKQLDDIVGGTVIIPDTTPNYRQTTLPYGSPTLVQHTWSCAIHPTTVCTVANAYRTTLEVSANTTNVNNQANVVLFDVTFFSDEIYGRRLSAATNFNSDEISRPSDYNYYKTYLKLDDETLVYQHIDNINPTQHYPVTLILRPDHPYAASAPGSTTAGDYMDTWVQKTVILNRPAFDRAGLGRYGAGACSPNGRTSVPTTPPIRIRWRNIRLASPVACRASHRPPAISSARSCRRAISRNTRAPRRSTPISPTRSRRSITCSAPSIPRTI